MVGDKRRLVGIAVALFLTASSALSDDLEGKIVTEIRIHGLAHTKDYVVARELVSRVGEPFSEQNLKKDAERLDRLRIFSSIEIRSVAVDSGVRIEIEVSETFPYMPIISIRVDDENDDAHRRRAQEQPDGRGELELLGPVRPARHGQQGHRHQQDQEQ